MDGHAGRYDAALTRAIRGDPHWVDGIAGEVNRLAGGQPRVVSVCGAAIIALNVVGRVLCVTKGTRKAVVRLS